MANLISSQRPDANINNHSIKVDGLDLSDLPLKQAQLPSLANLNLQKLKDITLERLENLLRKVERESSPIAELESPLSRTLFCAETASPHQGLVQNCCATIGKVAVVDSFTTPIIDIDDDGINDVTHGETVERYIQSYGVETLPIEVEKYDGVFSRIDSGVGEVIERVDRGEDIAAVNISLATQFSIEEWRELTGIEDLNTSNFVEHREEILASIAEAADELEKIEEIGSEGAKEVRSLLGAIEKIEELEKRGIDVYIPAGNDPQHVNLFGLARGADVVASLDDTGNDSGFSAQNDTVTRKERGEYTFIVVPGGIDITGDGSADFLPSDMSNAQLPPIGTEVGMIIGTSFSAPTAVGKDLGPKNTNGEAEY